MSRRKPLFHIGRINVLLGLIIIVAACQGTASQPATPMPLPETPMSIPTPESVATSTSEAAAEALEIPPTEYPLQLDATELARAENVLELPIVTSPEPRSLREATTTRQAGSSGNSFQQADSHAPPHTGVPAEQLCRLHNEIVRPGWN